MAPQQDDGIYPFLSYLDVSLSKLQLQEDEKDVSSMLVTTTTPTTTTTSTQQLIQSAITNIAGQYTAAVTTTAVSPEEVVRSDRQHGQRNRIVRFDLRYVSVINPMPEYYTEEDVSTKWISAHDLNHIKLDAKKLSAEIRKRNKEQKCCIVSVAHRKTTLILKSDFKGLLRLPPTEPDYDLIQWCSCLDGRRGLERLASVGYTLIRSSDIITTRTRVLDEQEYQRSRMSNSEIDGMTSWDSDIAISKVARECSRRARTFARYMGIADNVVSMVQEATSSTTSKRPAPLMSSSNYTAATTGNTTNTTSSLHSIMMMPTINKSNNDTVTYTYNTNLHPTHQHHHISQSHHHHHQPQMFIVSNNNCPVHIDCMNTNVLQYERVQHEVQPMAPHHDGVVSQPLHEGGGGGTYSSSTSTSCMVATSATIDHEPIPSSSLSSRSKHVPPKKKSKIIESLHYTNKQTAFASS